MNAPAKGLLKVSSILFIVFGAIATVASIIALVGSMALIALGASYDTSGATAVTGGILIIGSIVALVASIVELIIGILGVKKSADPAKANFFIVTGFIVGGLQLISIIISFNVLGIIGLVLPILFIIGGFQNKKAVEVSAAQA